MALNDDDDESSTPPPPSQEQQEDELGTLKPRQKQAHKLLENEPPFHEDLHVAYICQLGPKLDDPTSFEGALTEHLKLSGVYWSLTALSLLRPDQDKVNELLQVQDKILNWLFCCFDERSGGFGGNVGHDGHLLYTLSALQILALADALQDERLQSKRERILSFIQQLQQPNGAFCGDEAGEVDTRFTYCALQSLALLDALNKNNSDGSCVVRVDQAAEYVWQCQNDLDGGFGAVVGGESHAGQVFCCVGALAIAQRLDLLGVSSSSSSSKRTKKKTRHHRLAWWLAERQVDSGGLNGRPEKQSDVCYSWWILSSLSILGKVSWINQDKLAAFILQCQDDEDGGIADRPDDMADVFHTFFGVAGLSLLGHLHQEALPPKNEEETKDSSPTSRNSSRFGTIDPLYALPTRVVKRLKLPGQVLIERGQTVDERLSHYNVCYYDDLHTK